MNQKKSENLKRLLARGLDGKDLGAVISVDWIIIVVVSMIGLLIAHLGGTGMALNLMPLAIAAIVILGHIIARVKKNISEPEEGLNTTRIAVVDHIREPTTTPQQGGMTLSDLFVAVGMATILVIIFFPVVIQYSEKARAISCISNEKQIGTATLMYVQDYDETMPMYIRFDGRVTNPLDPNDTPGGSTGPGRWPTWQGGLFPYTNSWDIYNCPSDAYKKTDPVNRYYYLSYGYNNGYLSTCTVDAKGNQIWIGISLAAILRPALIVAFADGGGKDPNTSAYYGGNIVEAPDAYPSSQTWYVNRASPGSVGWGSDGGSLCHDKWGVTGCFAPRHNEGGNLVFCDGHAKYLKTGAAASGTTFNPNKPTASTCVLDYGKYLWDPRFESGKTCP